MTTTYRAVLQFMEGGPAVTGEWAFNDPARRTYQGWIGLYGSQPAVVIRLIEVIDGVEHVRRTWALQRETVTDPTEPPG